MNKPYEINLSVNRRVIFSEILSANLNLTPNVNLNAW